MGRADATDRGETESAPSIDFLAVRMSNLTFLARSMAHELRTPLCGATLQLSRMRELLAETQRHDAERARLASMAQAIHESVLAIRSGVDGLIGSIDPELAKCGQADLADVLREMCESLRVASIERSVQVTATLPGKALMCRAPRDRLRHAILGLAIEAMQALPTGGTLAVTLSRDDHGARVGLHAAGPDESPIPWVAPHGQDPAGDGRFAHVRMRVARQVAESLGGRIILEPDADRPSGIAMVLPTLAA